MKIKCLEKYWKAMKIKCLEKYWKALKIKSALKSTGGL